MSVQLSAIVSAIAVEAGLDPDRFAQDKTNIYRWINDVRREIYELPIQFSALQVVGEFAGFLTVTAGTVSATVGQAEVTGSGTAFSSVTNAANMNGRYIRIGNASGWQRISYVTDATHLTLESPWTNRVGSVAGATYIIWKRYYELPAKIKKINRLIDMDNNRFEIVYYDPSEFYRKYGFGDTFSLGSVAYTQFGTREYGYSYLESGVFSGITTTANSPIVDFASGSGLIYNMIPGNQVIIGNSTTSTAFVVDRVLTDTRVILTHNVDVSVSSVQATGLGLDRLLIQVHPAIDNQRIYYFEGYKKLYDVTSSADYIEDGWYNVVKKGCIAKAMGYTNNPREQMKMQEYKIELNDLIRNQYKALNPAIRLKPYIPRRYFHTGIYLSDRDDPNIR